MFDTISQFVISPFNEYSDHVPLHFHAQLTMENNNSETVNSRSDNGNVKNDYKWNDENRPCVKRQFV